MSNDNLSSAKKVVVVSGINLFQGGPLSIYYDFLDSFIRLSSFHDYEVIAFVHKVELFDKYRDCGIKFIELPKSRKSYLYRFYYEYSFFKKFSKGKDIYCWISLHDITPNVKAEKLFTYCHNPSPFRKITRIDRICGVKNVLFPLFYGRIYKKNIKKNTAIIVQQEWMREEFKKRYHVENVIVSYPKIDVPYLYSAGEKNIGKDTFDFIYPSFPRTFKNFEVICEAVKLLESEKLNFRVFFTLAGDENKYSRYLFRRYSGLKSIKWIGNRQRQELFELYNDVDCMIFPSRIETWGLPITEFKNTNKPILLSDCPFAHETIGDYEKVSFFGCDDSKRLAELMKQVILSEITFEKATSKRPAEIFKNDWNELIGYLLGEEV